jgi:hypothetical protein
VKESRSWSLAAMSVVFVALVGMVAVGCGGESDEDRIRTIVVDYYEHSAAEQCKTLTTGRFREAVYGGSGDGALEACEDHQRIRGKTPPLDRTVFIENVRVLDGKAIAEVRGGGVTLTDSLIERDGQWLLDDESSPFHASADAVPGVIEEEEEAEVLSFGKPASFTNIPGISPPAAVRLVAGEPIDPGMARDGEKRAAGRILNDFGQPGPVVELRFVNLPITLTNTGSRPFRGEVGAIATDQSGHGYPPLDRRELTQSIPMLGRLPDWVVGEVKGIAPGASVTRYVTVAVPEGKEIVEWVVKPSVLSEPGSVASMEPLEGVVYAPKAPGDSA